MIINLTKNSFIELKNEWSQLKGKYNWYSLTFIEFYVENETYTGGFEVMFMLLGLGFYFRWNYNPKILDNMAEEAKKEYEK